MRLLGGVLVLAAAIVLAGCVPGAGSTPPPVARASASPSTVPSPSPSPSPSPKASPSAPASPAGLYLQILQSEYGYLSAQTEAGATCSASGSLPDGRPLGGLANPQLAGADGMVSWRYPQAVTGTTGDGVHTVSCSSRGYSASQQANFILGA